MPWASSLHSEWIRCIILRLFDFLPYSEHKTCRHGGLQETQTYEYTPWFSLPSRHLFCLSTQRRVYRKRFKKKYSIHCQLWLEYPFKYLGSASLALWGWDMGNNIIHNFRSVFFLLAFFFCRGYPCTSIQGTVRMDKVETQIALFQ